MSPGIHNIGNRRWLLRTRSTSYVVALGDDNVPVCLFWGPPLSREQAAALPSASPELGSSFDGIAHGELLTETGPRFETPSLQIVHGDGARGIDWTHLGHEIDGGHLTLRFADRAHALEFDLHYRLWPDSDVIERWTALRPGEPVTLLRSDSAAWTVPLRHVHRLSHVTGGWGAEYALRRTDLPVGETVLTSRRGLTSHQANPWLMLDAGDAGERHGEVWSAALAWSGSWRITVRRDPAGRVGCTGGFGHEGLTWELGPGEEWVTPPFLGLYASDGFGGAGRRWHEHIVRHVLPAPDELRPVVYNAWEAVGFDVDEAGQHKLAGLAADVGAELFVVDDGWFGGRTSDRTGLGDWEPNPERFPQGLAPLVSEVHRLGMRFGLWVEPEMVNPDSALYRAHPDWVLHTPGGPRTELRNQLVLNFAKPDVADWAWKWLHRLVGEHDIDFLKWDFNRPFTEAGPDDRLWVDHVRAVYSILDRLRADHPRLRIEACAGGGGRADPGILVRTDQIWISDNTDAHDRVPIQHGFTQLYPARVMAAWVTDSPNPLTGRTTPLSFRFLVAMAGVLGLGGDLTAWNEKELAEAAGLVKIYKDIRPVVQLGTLDRLDHHGVQYSRDDRVIVLVWRGPRAHGSPVQPLRLVNLDPDGHYRDEDTGARHHGILLMSIGLIPRFAGTDHAAALIRLRKQTPP